MEATMIVLWSITLMGCQTPDPLEPPPPPAPIPAGPPGGDADTDADTDTDTDTDTDADTDSADTFDTGPLATSDWPTEWIAFEDEILTLVNAHRAIGTPCPETNSGISGPLVHDPLLREAARLHSQDMTLRDFFSHDDPDGDTVRIRIEATGYSGAPYGENIARGFGPSPELVMTSWMSSQVHCENIMDPEFRDIGIGHHFRETVDGPLRHWTQDFAVGN